MAFKSKPNRITLDDLASYSRGERIRLLRKLNNMTQQEVADAVSKSRPTIGNWEKDETEPDLDSVSIMAKEFNVPVELITQPQDA